MGEIRNNHLGCKNQPVNNVIFSMSIGAGFLPSTVCLEITANLTAPNHILSLNCKLVPLPSWKPQASLSKHLRLCETLSKGAEQAIIDDDYDDDDDDDDDMVVVVMMMMMMMLMMVMVMVMLMMLMMMMMMMVLSFDDGIL